LVERLERACYNQHKHYACRDLLLWYMTVRLLSLDSVPRHMNGYWPLLMNHPTLFKEASRMVRKRLPKQIRYYLSTYRIYQSTFVPSHPTYHATALLKNPQLRSLKIGCILYHGIFIGFHPNPRLKLFLARQACDPRASVEL